MRHSCAHVRIFADTELKAGSDIVAQELAS